MNIGRSISPYDKDILKELKHYWRDKVEIDFDITQEPCIFYDYYGAKTLVYKLSKTGSYTKTRWYYVCQAHQAILSFLIQQEKTKAEEITKFQNDFYKERERVKKEGYKDNI